MKSWFGLIGLLLIAWLSGCGQNQERPSVNRMLQDLGRTYSQIYPNTKQDEKILWLEWRYDQRKQEKGDERAWLEPAEENRKLLVTYLNELLRYMSEAPESKFRDKMFNKHFSHSVEIAYILEGAEQAREMMREVAAQKKETNPSFGERGFQRSLSNGAKQIGYYERLRATPGY